MNYIFTCILSLCAIALSAAAQGPKATSAVPLTTLSEIQPQNLAFEVGDNGEKFLAFRLRREGAPAVRVHITNMHLQAGERLYIYNPDRSEVYGPFQGDGPVGSREFWSEAIAGSDVVVEFQAKSDAPSDLPFRVAELKKTSLSDVSGKEAPRAEAVDNLFEGDILLTPEQASRLTGSKFKGKSAVAIPWSRYRWPGGIMPYVIAANVPNQGRITEAINHWNSVMDGTVQIVPRTNEANYVAFYLASNAGACSSNVGMTGFGGQPINVGNYCSTGNIIHEIGHAWGLWHEHTRADRDSYVKVNWANIQSGQSYNFNLNGSNGQDIARYDFGSIMHYNTTSFSFNGRPTLETKPAGIPIGQRQGLSAGDIEAIRFLYPFDPPPAPKVKVTIASNPAGLPVMVDGQRYNAPAVFEWTVGSVHNLSALDSLQAGVRHGFAKWSNGGARTHTLTASASVPMVKADYTLAYAISADAYPHGLVRFNPQSADGFYVADTVVNIAVEPPSGYCFTSWTGLIAGTPSRTSVSAVRPYDLQANVQPGSISLTLSEIRAMAAGGSYRVGLMASSGCAWSLSSSAPWVSFVTATSGTGSTSFWFQVAPNPSTSPRTAQVVAGDEVLVISQAGK